MEQSRCTDWHIIKNKVAIYNVNNSEVADLTSQGFGVIGSGGLSAMWALIHLGYS
ncbi:MAG: hypothetical protein RXQ75_03870 [Acidianus hospitalis]